MLATLDLSPRVCRANQWTGFYMMGTSVIKELKWFYYCILGNCKGTFRTMTRIYDGIFIITVNYCWDHSFSTYAKFPEKCVLRVKKC